jgi:hypothetical protein
LAAVQRTVPVGVSNWFQLSAVRATICPRLLIDSTSLKAGPGALSMLSNARAGPLRNHKVAMSVLLLELRVRPPTVPWLLITFGAWLLALAPGSDCGCVSCPLCPMKSSPPAKPASMPCALAATTLPFWLDSGVATLPTSCAGRLLELP